MTSHDLQQIEALLDRKVGGLKDDVGTLKDDVGTLKDDVGTLKDDVGTLKDDVGTLKDDVGTLKDDVGTLHEKADHTLELLRGMSGGRVERDEFVSAELRDHDRHITALENG